MSPCLIVTTCKALKKRVVITSACEIPELHNASLGQGKNPDLHNTNWENEEDHSNEEGNFDPLPLERYICICICLCNKSFTNNKK